MMYINIKKNLFTAQGNLKLEIDLSINTGTITTIYGASGAGKTTILRILAGLLNTEYGKIIIDNDVWLDTDNKINITPQKRNVGIVFQDYALFPNFTVKENLEYALNKVQNKNIIKDLLEIMELTELQNHYPVTLSGGQQQRIALARALVSKPKLLLLDEPMSALDKEMRSKIQDYILQIHKNYQLTILLVSHDISEIYKLSENMIVLEDGKITKQGSPATLFSNQFLSGKFQMLGEVLNIEKEDIIYIVSVLINNNIVKVVAFNDDIINLNIGDRVVVSSKAFNPVIFKV